MNSTDYFPLSIQLSAQARQRFDLEQLLRPRPGGSALYPLRTLAAQLQKRPQSPPVSAGQLHLLAMLNRVFRLLCGRYFDLRQAALGVEGVQLAERTLPLADLNPALDAFLHCFPPAWPGPPADLSAQLRGPHGTAQCRSAVIEMYILSIQTGNRAAAPMADLFDDTELCKTYPYRHTLAQLSQLLLQQPASGLFERPLPELLLAPLLAAPDSLSGQLRYIRTHWSEWLPPELLRDILVAFDLLQEEQQVRGGGPGATAVPTFAPDGYPEPERFSPDTDWMPNTVLIAKTIYVWLDQLSRYYGRTISRLDQIPDQELERLHRWGFTSLWLIGIWERSPASQSIKQRMGNPEAVASAYSLYDYVVATDLGGEAALTELRQRCSGRGIRLGCDVVPNHTGIYSRWTREHPDWFIQVEQPPYPAYQFNGPDLSESDDVGIFIEDGYWSHTDAAVVFKHLDRRSGRVRYLYHGNDGTHLPWNDTAQLNFLLPQVREAMVRLIVEVARRFPVIRFDAAMTLAKKHFQRLWFPQPGGGAGVPSRSEHTMERDRFEELFPTEFWREVVDRVAVEAPDTLLLAEAFWLMEGYFVRTLGMHRVYNSAFMNMLKTEDNAKYRTVVKNILEFNHEILKRFVNFMNNPDEATAVAQFGKGDKYFAVAVLLSTLPGLPMFGHGQVEGLEEKYGMEYRRAYRNETPDDGFIRFHEGQIFPLLRRRPLFSGSRNFVLYDFFSGGHVNEDVFAYSNRHHGERSLVVVHNRAADTGGWLHRSCAKLEKGGEGEVLAQPTLAEALELNPAPERFYRFREHRSSLEYLRRGADLVAEGFYLQLGPYQYQVFLDFAEIVDQDGSWADLCRRLDGRPVASLDTEWKRLRYTGLHEALRRTLFPARSAVLAQKLLDPAVKQPLQTEAAVTFGHDLAALFQELQQPGDGSRAQTLAEEVTRDLLALRTLAALRGRSRAQREAVANLTGWLTPPAGLNLQLLLAWLVLRRIGELPGGDAPTETTAALLEQRLLSHPLASVLAPASPTEMTAESALLLVQVLLRHQDFGAEQPSLPLQMRGLLQDSQVREFLGCNRFEGVLWFNRERFETLLSWLPVMATLAGATRPKTTRTALLTRLTDLHLALATLRGHGEKCGYRLENLLDIL